MFLFFIRYFKTCNICAKKNRKLNQQRQVEWQFFYNLSVLILLEMSFSPFCSSIWRLFGAHFDIEVRGTKQVNNISKNLTITKTTNKIVVMSISLIQIPWYYFLFNKISEKKRKFCWIFKKNIFIFNERKIIGSENLS